MEQMTWLQCQMPRPEWEKLDKRRRALKVKWADILVPGAIIQMEKLEKNPPAPKVEKAKEPKPSSKEKQ